MEQAIWGTIIISLIFGLIVVAVSIYKALKHPDEYQKMSDDLYQKFNKSKAEIKKNTISWEEAKKQAAIELEIEAQMKAEKKMNKKNKNS